MRIFALGQAGKSARWWMGQGEPSEQEIYDGWVAVEWLEDRPKPQRAQISNDGLSIVDADVDPAEALELAWARIRMDRNSYLNDCAWTILPDAPLTVECRSKFLAYRAALNRLTIDFAKPSDVVFPIRPAEEYPPSVGGVIIASAPVKVNMKAVSSAPVVNAVRTVLPK